jgi:hypothetical protein
MSDNADVKWQRNIGYLLIVVALIVFPSAASLTWYQVTKDPTVRPLGITKEALREFYGLLGGVEIVAVVGWDERRSGRVTKRQIANSLYKAFEAKGVEARVVFTPSTKGTWVAYEIGPTTIGPYPQSRAAEGIRSAVEAYRMHVPWKP